MENTCGRLLPPPGAITMVEVNLKRTFYSGEWEKGAAIKDNVIIVEKVGIWPMCALLNVVATKAAKKEEIKIIQTANISYSTLIYFIFTNMLFLLIVLLILI